MAGIGLPDGDDVEHARAAELVTQSGTPESPARSTSSQIIPAFITHLENEKSEGGRIGEAIPRIGSDRW